MTKKKASFPIKPLSKYLFVKRVEEISVTEGGIYVPDAAKEKPQYGLVLEVGSDVDEATNGDVILFGKYAGAEVNIVQGDPVLMLEKDEIVGIVTDEKMIKLLLKE